MSRFDLSIGDVVARTGVGEPALRMWERRFGFPEPRRTDSGHRRYSQEQVVAVERVLALRQSGLSLPAAITRALMPPDPDRISLFSSLRSQWPELEPRTVSKPMLVALSHAIEDEMLARAEARVAFACFQRESFYRSAQSRWRELSAATRVAAVFADFDHAAAPPDRGPAEVPITRRQQVAREWAIVLHGGGSSICMVARELASSNADAASAARFFELLWTVEPEAVLAAARTCVALLRVSFPELAAAAEPELAVDAPGAPVEQARLTTAVANRVLSALS